jgi:hypothetical protein
MRFASGSATNAIRVGTQLKIIPVRVTVRGFDDSAAAVSIPEIGVNVPEGARPSTPTA